MINNGKYNEDQIIHSLNVERFDELPRHLQNLVKVAFGIIELDKPVKCEHAEDYIKPDFVITHCDRKKYVSMKSGKSKNVHGEPIGDFMNFLKEIGVSEKTISTMWMLHYRDGTDNGTGEKEIELEDLKYQLRARIKEANKELNSSRELLVKFANRVLFQGIREDAPSVDVIYHGDYEYGFLATKTQITKYLYTDNWDFFSNLHIGPFHIYPRSIFETLRRTDGRDMKRVEVTWPLIINDLIYIARNISGYEPIKNK